MTGLCAIESAEHGFDFLMRHGCPNGTSKGIVISTDRLGRTVCARRDTHGHAFILSAIRWFYRATGRGDALAAMEDTCKRLRPQLASSLCCVFFAFADLVADR